MSDDLIAPPPMHQADDAPAPVEDDLPPAEPEADLSISDTQISQLRIPPHSLEAESSVLGGLLLDNSTWDRVGDLLIDSDFYRFEHKLIYAACGRLINESKPADVITVFEELIVRVGEGLFASVGSLGIEPIEYGERHKYLASYLEPTRIIAY